MKTFTILLLTMIFFISFTNVLGQKESKKNNQKEHATEIQNNSLSFLPKGTIINKRTKDKIYCFLPRNTEIQGILCRGDRHRGWETVLYVNGKLLKAWLARTEEIQGVPCMKATFWTEFLGGDAAVYFHSNGKLAKCKLARDVTINGHRFKKGDHVCFDSEGKLILEKP